MSDHAIFALHKYYLRAQKMRGQFYATLEKHFGNYGPGISNENLQVTGEHFDMQMYLDYWYAALYVVVEGYEKLSLMDPDVEAALASPLRNKLNSYRQGIYHYNEVYFDPEKYSLIKEVGSVAWVTGLDVALGRFLLKEMKRRREESADA